MAGISLAGEKDAPVAGAPAAAKGAGGPDAFGYRWADSDEPGGPAYSWIEISGTGTPLDLTDDGEANIVCPFPFTFYGVSATDMRVGNNGGIIFNATTGDVWAGNSALAYNGIPPMMILPFWDDIDSDSGNVYWEVQGTEPDRQLIVEWYNRPHYSNTGSGTFELVLYEGSNNILFQYADLDFGNASFNYGISATVGIQGDTVDANNWFLQYSYNTASLHDNMAIKYTYHAPVHAFGTIDTTVIITSIPSYSFAGITFCPADSMFYLVSQSTDSVYRLDPDTWSWEAAFAATDPWGLAWDGTYFWVSSISPNYVRQYTYAGTPTGYYCDVSGIGGSSWMGAMDYDGTYMWQIAVGGSNMLYRLNLLTGVVVDTIPSVPWSTSQRACCWIPYTSEFISGGWNTQQIYRLDTLGSVLDSANMGNLADFDLYDFVGVGEELWGLAVQNDASNYIRKVWLGITRPATGVVSGPSAPLGPANALMLAPNRPNPFRGSTRIDFQLPKAGKASLKVYNIQGQAVATLVDGDLSAGRHQVAFNARGLANGIYLYRLEAGGQRLTRKLAVIK